MTFPALLSSQVGAFLPAPVVPGLDDDEQSLMAFLQQKLVFQTLDMALRTQYYDGEQRLVSLGISVPPQMENVRMVLDWPRITVDPLVERAVVQGFRLPGGTEVDDELEGFWQGNNLDAEFPLVVQDQLVKGRGYMIVGSPDRPGDVPLITVESPLNLAMNWDPRTRRASASFQMYEVEGEVRAALYLPTVTIQMSRGTQSGWTVDDRDEHGLGEVSVVRFPNRSRSDDRDGRSEITNAVMSHTDEAARTLLGLASAREFYSVPRLFALGVAKSAFQNANGDAISAWDAIMSKLMAFENDEQGNTPKIQQMTAYNPAVYTDVISMYGKLMSSATGLPPDYFGVTTDANPSSGDAMRMAQDRMDRRGEKVQLQNDDPLETVQRLAWRFAHNGAQVPAEYMRLETDWRSVSTATPTATADAVAKQVASGILPAASDVTLSQLGYSPLERRRIAQDRDADRAETMLLEASQNIEARALRSAGTVNRAAGAATATPPAPTAVPNAPAGS